MKAPFNQPWRAIKAFVKGNISSIGICISSESKVPALV